MSRKKDFGNSRGDLIREKLQLIDSTEDIDEIINYTRDPDPQFRRRALRHICPCQVYDKIELFWERVLEMVDDEDEGVRADVLHVLCDGSPEHLEDRIMAAVRTFNSDSNSHTRRTAHKVIGTYNKTGKWNIL